MMLKCFLGLTLWVVALNGLPSVSSPSKMNKLFDEESSACSNITNMENFDLEKFMKEQWMEVLRSNNTFEKDCNSIIKYDYNDGFFKMNFENQISFNGDTIGGIQQLQVGDIMYRHVVLDTDYTSYAILYTCLEENRDSSTTEWFWLLNRYITEDNINEMEKLNQYPYLKNVIGISPLCSSDVPTTPVVTETAQEEDTTTFSDTTSSPVPKGFQIPNCNKTFYFLAQFDPDTIDE